MTESLSFTVQQPAGAVAVVQVSGAMDIDSCPPLEQALTDLVDAGTRHLVLDMGTVDFCDSSGFNALLRTRAHADQQQGVLVLAAVPPTVRRPMELVGLGAVIPLFPTVAAALENASG